MPTLQHRSEPSLFSHHPQLVSQSFHTAPSLQKHLPEVPRSPCAGAKPQPPTPAPWGTHKPTPGGGREGNGQGDRASAARRSARRAVENACSFLTATTVGRPQGPARSHPPTPRSPEARRHYQQPEPVPRAERRSPGPKPTPKGPSPPPVPPPQPETQGRAHLPARRRPAA